MNANKGHPGTQIMPFVIRPLEERDIGQSADIERDAFPTLFPPTSFRRELRNRRASYLVAGLREDMAETAQDAPDSPNPHQRDSSRPFFNRLLRDARHLWQRRDTALEPGQQLIVGFLGVWYMTDEAHIISVGVRNGYRGRGIGELLLIGAIEQAMSRQARVVTLEVRVSNHVARNLYVKYGFKERGIRKAYYTDNREDAIIMTTDPIHTSPYPEELRRLITAYEQRWGRAERVLS